MKNEILQKSLPYFLKHGIREMSNNKLVELLGISTKTIYKYFKNKEDLLEEALYLYHAEQQEKTKNLPVTQSAATLFFDIWHLALTNEYNVNNAFFRDLHYYYPELERKIETEVTQKYTKEFVRIIRRGIEKGSFRKDIIPEVVLENIYVQYEAVARSERFTRFRLSIENILLNTIALTIRGICTSKGAEELDKHIQTRDSTVKGKKTSKKPATSQ